ncbi:dienelactone hydrolase family protein [Polaribacter sp. MED152]|uniref:dienelactone hydrolase family protein n=1 Tax=Polaribacter sp. MED152 TaxID=313598 RepID=UPI000068C7D7|nr:dienelactone hydrolase family protein [Polaribacter sp. MED152]EAQ42239.1 dienelactone hydrolase family protein [Polaribacter sp. MED152]
MASLKKEDISQEVFDLYDDYAHNKLTRKQFLEKLSLYAVGAITLPALLSFISPNYIDSILVQPNDPRLDSKMINYESPKGGQKMKGLLSIPKNSTEKLPGILVVHENRGLNPYIKDVGRRAALDGYITLAPDALAPLGGYPGNDDEGRAMQRKRDRNEMIEDFIAGYHYLKNHKNCNGKIGVVGFCFGGYISNILAVRIPELAASVPYYGRQPSAEDAAKVKAPLLLQYAGLDKRVNAGWPDYEKILKENNVTYTAHFYPDVNHGFHNNTTPRYDEEAADLSWARTMDFFKTHLKG